LQTLAPKGELLGGQGHAGHLCAEFIRGLFRQCTPAAANLQQALARLQAHLLQGAAHLGVLGLGQVACQVALEPGGRVVHARVQPAL
jgi:hypothetical protein